MLGNVSKGLSMQGDEPSPRPKAGGIFSLLDEIEHLSEQLDLLRSAAEAILPRCPPTEVQYARQLLWQRRRRDMKLGANLFADPAWDMILDLFVAHEEGKRVTVGSLCIAAAVPQTTALRWINVLVERGYIVRRPKGATRSWIELTPETMASVRDLLRDFIKRAS